MTVIVVDDHNGLCGKGSKYIGLNPNEAATETERAQRTQVLREYCDFFTELTYFGRVVYCYSPCPERFQMGMRLSNDSTMLAGMSKQFGCLPVNIEPFWLSLEPFTLPSRSDPHVRDPWHHCDPTGKWILVHLWDALIKKLIYLALSNCGTPIYCWDQYDTIQMPPPPPIIPVVVVREAEASEPTATAAPVAEATG